MISEAESELASHGCGLDSNHGCVSVAKSFNSGSDFRSSQLYVRRPQIESTWSLLETGSKDVTITRS